MAKDSDLKEKSHKEKLAEETHDDNGTEKPSNKWEELANSEVNEASENVEGLEHPDYETLSKQLTEMEQKASEATEKHLRTLAEMDNMRRRQERDLTSAHKFALEKFCKELLPVVDSLERALTAFNDSKDDSHREGVDLTFKMLLTTLEKFGVKVINPQGETFNPSYHEAVTTQAKDGAKANEIIEVLQKGYTLHDRLIRPAMVVVAKG